MGCRLGWHFTVGCPLRGGRGKCKIIGTSVPPKTIKKKKVHDAAGKSAHNILHTIHIIQAVGVCSIYLRVNRPINII
jgi:hypothetical protein